MEKRQYETQEDKDKIVSDVRSEGKYIVGEENLIDGNFLLVDDRPFGYNRTADDIDKQTVAKIRTRYSEDDAEKLNRLMNAVNAGIIEDAGDSIRQQFIDYNNFVEQCKAEGKIEKAELAKLKEEFDNGEN